MLECFCQELFQLVPKDKWVYCRSYVCDSCVKNILEAKNELIRENERLQRENRELSSRVQQA